MPVCQLATAWRQLRQIEPTDVAVPGDGAVDELAQRLGLHVLGLDGEEEVCESAYPSRKNSCSWSV